LHKKTILKEICLKDCSVMCFSEIKWFRERFEATTYILLSVKSF
jgi:hypothetical protein